MKSAGHGRFTKVIVVKKAVYFTPEIAGQGRFTKVVVIKRAVYLRKRWTWSLYKDDRIYERMFKKVRDLVGIKWWS
jgi:hypothetical protein